MKQNLKWFLLILGMFCIGGLGSLFVNYIVFSKLVDNPKWSENGIVKALSNKVTVINNVGTEKVIVKDSESLSVVSSQVLSGVVYVEEVFPAESSLMPKGGNGIVMSSDGIVAIHKSVFEQNTENYLVSFSDKIVKEAKKVFEDEYTGIIFLKLEMNNLTAMPFVNSSDVIGGKKLVNIYREKRSEQVFYNLGILSGFDYDFKTQEPSCDYLQGAFRVDFNEKALKYGLGGPMIDFNGQMVGLLAKKKYDEYLLANVLNKKNESLALITEEEYFLIASNDVKDAFDRFLKQNSIDQKENKISEAKLEVSCEFRNESVDGEKIYFENRVGNKKLPSAFSSGLKEGDLILQVDDKKVDLKNSLSKILLNYKKGDKAKFKLQREEKEMELEITF